MNSNIEGKINNTLRHIDTKRKSIDPSVFNDICNDDDLFNSKDIMMKIFQWKKSFYTTHLHI